MINHSLTNIYLLFIFIKFTLVYNSFDFDPTTRHTFWSLIIGGFFFWGAWYSVEQTIVQRCLAMPSFRDAHMSVEIKYNLENDDTFYTLLNDFLRMYSAIWGNAIAVSGTILLCCLFGLLIHARFFDCDPLTSKVSYKKHNSNRYN